MEEQVAGAGVALSAGIETPPLWSHLLFAPLWPEAGGSLESDPNVVCVPTVPAVVPGELPTCVMADVVHDTWGIINKRWFLL